jgi:hypothetical protein
MQIVDEKSAVLAGNTPIGINKNHREMSKFKTEDDHDTILSNTLSSVGLDQKPLSKVSK